MRSPNLAGSRLLAVFLLSFGLPTADASDTVDEELSSRLSEATFLESISPNGPGGDPSAGPDLEALLGEELAIARSEHLARRRLPDPELSFEREAAGEERETSWSLGWTLPIDGRRRPLSAAAEAGIAAARERSRAHSLELRLEIRRVFAEWALAHARRGVLAEHAERLVELARDLEHQARVGDTSGLEARRLALAGRIARGEELQAEAAEAMASATARAWLPDLPTDARPVLVLPPMPTVRPEEQPQVTALRHELERRRHQLAAGRRWLSAPRLELGWKTVEPDLFEEERDGAVVAIGWTVPLFDRRQDERLAAEARIAASETRLELAGRQLGGELEGARRAYRQLLDAVESSTIITGHEELVIESALTAYRLGESDATDLLSTLETVKAARLAQLDLLGTAHATHRALERATGHPLDLTAGEEP